MKTMIPTHSQKRRYATDPLHRAARKAVWKAVKAGQLPRASALSCCQCGQPAMSYHHYRDYAPEHWLHVYAVCAECHAAEHGGKR